MDLILVNSVTSPELLILHRTIISQAIVCYSRVRRNWLEYIKIESKFPHWKVGGATDITLWYTLFCSTTQQKTAWLSHTIVSKPHTDVLLHTNSASGINKNQISNFTCKIYKGLSEKEYVNPKLHIVSQKVYHPSGLFPHQINKPVFVLPCIFSAT